MPPAAVDIRRTYEIMPLRGIGGCLWFRWPLEGGTQPDYERLEIEQWEIFHKYRNLELAMSGGRGSIQRRRVADDFEFVLALDLDLTPVRTTAITIGPNPNGKTPFIDGRLEGVPSRQFRIEVIFQCGDPTFWNQPDLRSIARPHPDPNIRGVYYACNSVVLDEVRTIDSSRGDDVVRCIVRGSGSAPLERWISTGQASAPDQLEPGWCGEGALGFDQRA